MYMTTGYFHHLYELLTDLKGDIYPSAYGQNINGHKFVSGLLNAHLVDNPDEIPLVVYLINNLQNTYRLNTGLLQRFIQASYDDERQVHRARLVLQPLNASQIPFIWQDLCENATFTN